MTLIPEERETPEGLTQPDNELARAWRKIGAALLIERYQFAAEYVAGKAVLDIPSGVGWGTSMLVQATRRLGIDLDLASCQYGLRRWGIASACASMTALPLASETVDVVSCFEGLEHLTRQQGIQFVAEAQRVLRPDGMLIGSVPVLLPGSRHTGNPYHLYEYPVADLERLLSRYFAVVQCTLALGGSGVIAYFVAKERNISLPPDLPAANRNIALSVLESMDQAEQIMTRYSHSHRLVFITERSELLTESLCMAAERANADLVNCLKIADPWLSELTTRLRRETTGELLAVDARGELVPLADFASSYALSTTGQTASAPAGGLDRAGAQSLFRFLQDARRPPFRSAALERELRQKHLERICCAAIFYRDRPLARRAAWRLLTLDVRNRWYAKLLLSSVGVWPQSGCEGASP